MLQGALDSARSLTGARYGVIALHNDAGVAEDFLSSGMTADESDRLWNIPDWPTHFAYLSKLPGPLRIPDLLSHLRLLGLPEMRPPIEVSEKVSFLAFPILHRGERVGSIYLAEKEGGREFTREDEETLALFASQAAMAITNARQHREERRARADLETLIDTSPVGVVVLDAATGMPRSLNQEARRIVDILRDPDQTPEQFLEVLSLKRDDGREISLKEFPIAELLRIGETVLAEGNCHGSAGRTKRQRSAQCHSHQDGRWRGGLGRSYAARHDASAGNGAYARRISRNGKPRAARSTDLDQGLGNHRIRRIVRAGSG